MGQQGKEEAWGKAAACEAHAQATADRKLQAAFRSFAIRGSVSATMRSLGRTWQLTPTG
jgi:hypothetical protein